MKYILPIFLFITSSLFAQSTRISDKSLYTLGKVWGLMKYYHPAASQGKIDWDGILITTLENKTVLTDDQIIARWFSEADKTAIETVTVKSNDCDSITRRNFNSAWIEKTKNISSETKKKLMELVKNPKNVGTFYSNSDSDGIRFSSKNEKVYAATSPQLKMVELFRIWNAIEYFYPYKYLLDRDWNAVLKQYIPIFKNLSSEQDYKLVLSQLTAEINDTHSKLSNTYQYDIFGKLTAPFIFQVVENGVLITGIKDQKKTQQAGISIGDFITKINGKTISKISAEKSKYIPVSNPAVRNREAYNYLFSGNDAIFTVEGIKENGTVFKTNLERMPRIFKEEWDQDGIPNYHLNYKGKTYDYLVWNEKRSALNPGFQLNDKAYIEFSSLLPKDIDSLMLAFKDKKGIVFDLRGYNNNASLLHTFDYLYPKPQCFGIKTQANFSQPGTFCFVDNIIDKSYKYVGKENPDAYKGKVIVLINEYTQSAEEMWGMVFKKIPNVLFIGSQTAGADGNITNIKLTDGNELLFSGLGIYYPDGTETQRIGIKPDIVVRPTVKSIRRKEDLLLQKAFEVIDQGN